MSSSASDQTIARYPAFSDVLALGFGASVAMWSIGYLGNLPALAGFLPRWVTLLLMLACLFYCCFRAGQLTGRGWLGGLWTALVSALINLLVLGALKDELSGGGAPQLLVWLLGYFALSAVIGVLGGALGRTKRDTRKAPTDWLGVFSWVTVAATLLLIAKGGVVTSYGNTAALSVPDWPQSFGYNMFLLPLSKMAGPVYFEHAHRLFGTLVGLTTVVLALLVSLSRVKPLTKVMAWLAVLLVIAQGILGGVRVTLTDTTLAFLHGVLAQLFLGVLGFISVQASALFNSGRSPKLCATAGADRVSTVIAVILVVGQLFLGAVVRHFNPSGGVVMLHIAVGTIVLAACVTAGIRHWGNHVDVTALRKAGASVMHLAGTQYLLGFLAWATGVTKLANDAVPTNVWQIILPTLHQAVGALLLVYTVRLAVLSFRLLQEESSEQQAAA
ncbi:COX15/CtaA family protein [bacterium]|nr:COX15/CtaA family protein [bacterium]